MVYVVRTRDKVLVELSHLLAQSGVLQLQGCQSVQYADDVFIMPHLVTRQSVEIVQDQLVQVTAHKGP